jgi:hypothetical protein
VRVLWVSPVGNDSTATGSRELPFLTIEAAMAVFVSGDQIRLETGTYTPADSLIFSSLDGSIVSDTPGSATIQPVQTTNAATILISDCERFTVRGLCIVQASTPSNNSMGIQAISVDHFICDSCIIRDFLVTNTDSYGIYVSDSYGIVIRCHVENITNTYGNIYGVVAYTLDIVDCHTYDLNGTLAVVGIYAGKLWYLQDLIAYYKFELNANDSSDNDYHGTLESSNIPWDYNDDTHSTGYAVWDSNRNVVLMLNVNETLEWDGVNWKDRSHPSQSILPLGVSWSRWTGFGLAFDRSRNVAVTFGGIISDPGFAYLDSTFEWSSANRAWVEVFPAHKPSARRSHALGYDETRHEIVLFGGYTGAPNDETWVWDGVDWTQRFPASKPSARGKASFAWDSDREKLFLFGGWNEVTRYQDCWEWDGTNWTDVTPGGLKPEIRHSGEMVYDRVNNCMILFGGYAIVGVSLIHMCDTWKWEWTGGVPSWTELTPTSTPGNDVGGIAYDEVRHQIVLCRTWLWNGTNWKGDCPLNITYPAAAYDSRRKIVVQFGGGILFGVVKVTSQNTFEWDGCKWSDKTLDSGNPPARYYSKMCYDVLRNRTVLFGGFDGDVTNFQDTWEWNGITWTERFPMDKPSVRRDFAMAYDSVRNRTVLFGGWNGVLNYQDTWEWDGTNWTEILPVAKPSARYGCTATFDSVRNRVVLFGGYDVDYLQDTWEWNGVNWVDVTPGGLKPDARFGANFAYDSYRNKIIMSYGENAVWGSFADTWEWDGGTATWTQRIPMGISEPSSSKTVGHMVYDSEHRCMVVYSWPDVAPTASFGLYSSGKIGRGLVCDGYYDNVPNAIGYRQAVILPDDINNDILAYKALSISCFVKIRLYDSPPTEKQMFVSRLLDIGGVYTGSFGFGTFTDHEKLEAKVIFSGGIATAKSSFRLVSDTWYHVGMTVSESDSIIRLYINGKLDTVGVASSGTFIDTEAGAKMLIGANQCTLLSQRGDWLDGVIDNVIMYGRVLTAAEMALLCKDGLGFSW